MRTMTRTEKWQEAGRAIKKAMTLLVLTAIMVVLMALGICLGAEKRNNEKLQNQIVELENKSQETGAKYDIIYVERR